MSVHVGKDRIMLIGIATVEDAEPLLAALLNHPDHPVDIGGLERAHFAVVQLLHAAGRPLCNAANASPPIGMALASLMRSEA